MDAYCSRLGLQASQARSWICRENSSTWKEMRISWWKYWQGYLEEWWKRDGTIRLPQDFMIKCKCNGSNVKEHVRKVYIVLVLSDFCVNFSTFSKQFQTLHFSNEQVTLNDTCLSAFCGTVVVTWVRFQHLPIGICLAMIVVPSSHSAKYSHCRHIVIYRLSAPLYVWVPLPVWVMDKLGNSSEWQFIETREEYRIWG